MVAQLRLLPTLCRIPRPLAGRWTFRAETWRSSTLAFVAVFPAGSKNPISYNTLLKPLTYCGYDNVGNLFVDGFDGSKWGLSELPEGGSTFEKLTLDQSVGQPGQVQWDGQYLSYESAGEWSTYIFAVVHLWLDSNCRGANSS